MKNKMLVAVFVISLTSASAARAEDIKVDFDGRVSGSGLAQVLKDMEPTAAVPAFTSATCDKTVSNDLRGLIHLNMRTSGEGNYLMARDPGTGTNFGVQQRNYPNDEEYLHFELIGDYMGRSYSMEILQYLMQGQQFFHIKESGLDIYMDPKGGGRYSITGWYSEAGASKEVFIRIAPLDLGYGYAASGDGFDIKYADHIISGTIDQNKYRGDITVLLMGMFLLAR